MKLSSPLLEANKFIPRKFSPPREELRPHVFIEDIPPKTRSLAMFFEELGQESRGLSAAESPDSQTSGPLGTSRYVFRAYALDAVLGLYEKVGKTDLEKTFAEHIIEKAELVGEYVIENLE